MPIFLDTHLVIGICAGDQAKLSPTACQLIESCELQISPIVLLELQLLYEIGRLTDPPEALFEELRTCIGLELATDSLIKVVEQASTIKWTRDPFDRLIVGHAAVNGSLLVTKDSVIQSYYPRARW